MGTIRILIVDDHKLFAEAIRVALQNVGMAVIAVVERGSEALEAVTGARPDIILMDIGLPDESGLVVGRRILEHDPDAKIIAVTALADRSIADEALHAGFVGYLTKDTPVRQFVSALRSALEGHTVLPLGLSGGGRVARQEEEVTLLASQLTPREREVLALLARGANGRVASAALGISQNTVRTHVQSILTKLQVHSRLEAATFAVRHRLVEVVEPGDSRIA